MKSSEKRNTKQLWRRRRECFAAYNRWQAAHPVRLSAAEAICRIAAIYELLPEEARHKDLATKIEGIRKMRKALSVLGSKES